MVFLHSIILSFLNVLDEPTTFEESKIAHEGTLPSVTICESNLESLDNFTNFEAIIQAIEQVKQSNQVEWFYQSINDGRVEIDLKNESMVSKKFGISVDDILSYGATIQQEYPYRIIICTTLNLDFVKAPPDEGILGVKITIYPQDPTIQDGYYFSRHEPGQSTYNFQFLMLDDFDILYKNSASSFTTIPTKTISKRRSSYFCDEDNSMRFTSCIDEFIADELNCTLPWSRPRVLSKCHTENQLEQFRQLHKYLTSNATKARIQSTKGCLTPNCVQTTWKKSHTNSAPLKGNNITKVYMTLPSYSYLNVRKEILLADISTFVADFGSYLGLFLGASILSIIDVIYTFIGRKVICQSCQSGSGQCQKFCENKF